MRCGKRPGTDVGQLLFLSCFTHQGTVQTNLCPNEKRKTVIPKQHCYGLKDIANINSLKKINKSLLTV
jgi:hypothetical protein